MSLASAQKAWRQAVCYEATDDIDEELEIVVDRYDVNARQCVDSLK